MRKGQTSALVIFILVAVVGLGALWFSARGVPQVSIPQVGRPGKATATACALPSNAPSNAIQLLTACPTCPGEGCDCHGVCCKGWHYLSFPVTNPEMIHFDFLYSEVGRVEADTSAGRRLVLQEFGGNNQCNLPATFDTTVTQLRSGGTLAADETITTLYVGYAASGETRYNQLEITAGWYTKAIICKPNSLTCVENTIKECSGDGTDYKKIPCKNPTPFCYQSSAGAKCVECLSNNDCAASKKCIGNQCISPYVSRCTERPSPVNPKAPGFVIRIDANGNEFPQGDKCEMVHGRARNSELLCINGVYRAQVAPCTTDPVKYPERNKCTTPASMSTPVGPVQSNACA